jgi:hypothetical protein
VVDFKGVKGLRWIGTRGRIINGDSQATCTFGPRAGSSDSGLR